MTGIPVSQTRPSAPFAFINGDGFKYCRQIHCCLCCSLAGDQWPALLVGNPYLDTLAIGVALAEERS